MLYKRRVTKAAEASANDHRLGAVTVLTGARGGKYPHGNSICIEGAEETLLVDPSLSLIARRGELARVDHIVNSHCHEDHVAGNHLFPNVPWFLHELDLPGMLSFEGLLAIYGYDEYPEVETGFREILLREFHYTARPDARSFTDGQLFDLGGAVRMRVIHAPGHTRGHCVFHVEPDDVLYLGDIDLSSFGPYYGDAWSSLEDFERTLKAVRHMRARWYATFHHVGVLEGREAFLERLDRFEAVIADRERRLLEYVREARTLDEIVAHRFVYRPQDAVSFADPVERRSMSQHLDRLIDGGRVRVVAEGRFQAC
jgi:glyoxylase-like metal-dependent hydrolase (beta-lactamase superfamily II)